MDNARLGTIRDIDDNDTMDFVMNDDMELQLAARVAVEFRNDLWTAPPEALLLYYRFDKGTYSAPVVLARITVGSYSNPKETLYGLWGTLEYTGKFSRNDRIRVVYSYAATVYPRTYRASCELEVRSCTRVPPSPRPQ